MDIINDKNFVLFNKQLNIYADKDNIICAEYNNSNNKNVDAFIDIIASINKLTNADACVLDFMFKHKELEYSVLMDNIKNKYCISDRSIRRSICKLIHKDIIVNDGGSKYMLHDNYNINIKENGQLIFSIIIK